MDIIIELCDKIKLDGDEKIEYTNKKNKLTLHVGEKKIVYEIKEHPFSFIAVYNNNEYVLINHLGKSKW